jgi:hypothetical protein
MDEKNTHRKTERSSKMKVSTKDSVQTTTINPPTRWLKVKILLTIAHNFSRLQNIVNVHQGLQRRQRALPCNSNFMTIKRKAHPPQSCLDGSDNCRMLCKFHPSWARLCIECTHGPNIMHYAKRRLRSVGIAVQAMQSS